MGKHESLKRGRGRPKKVEKKKPEGSGVIAGPAIRMGWGRHNYGADGMVGNERTPTRIGGRS